MFVRLEYHSALRLKAAGQVVPVRLAQVTVLTASSATQVVIERGGYKACVPREGTG